MTADEYSAYSLSHVVFIHKRSHVLDKPFGNCRPSTISHWALQRRYRFAQKNNYFHVSRL